MVASITTVRDVLKIIKQYVPEEKRQDFIRDLSLVDGNRSFTQTVKRIVLVEQGAPNKEIARVLK